MRKGFQWESVTALSSAAVAIMAFLAGFFTFQQISDFRDAAKIQHLAEESRAFDSPNFLSIRKGLASKRIDTAGKLKELDPANPPIEIYEILNYFDYLGLLHKRGYLDANDVWEVFGYWMDNFYADSLPVIKQEQKDSPNTYRNFEALAAIVRAIDKRRGEGTDPPSPEDLADFYAYEAAQVSGLPAQSATQAKTVRRRGPGGKPKPTRTSTPQ